MGDGVYEGFDMVSVDVDGVKRVEKVPNAKGGERRERGGEVEGDGLEL
jgi:hypothetical protein